MQNRGASFWIKIGLAAALLMALVNWYDYPFSLLLQPKAFRDAYAKRRDFYGVVVDDWDRPIAGASASIAVFDYPSSTRNSPKYYLESDEHGRFSLLGKRGASFYIKAYKEGYYAYSASSGSVEYALPGDKFSYMPPTREQPTKFRLHESHPAELVYHETLHKIARDGTPCEVSFATGQKVALGQGDLRVEAWTIDDGPVPGGRFEWRCRVSVPGGGLQERQGELSFEAPEVGYVPAFEFDKESERRSQVPGSARKQLFVKTSQGKYARIQFEMIAGGNNFFVLESYINPTGSRNLEEAPGKHGHGR